MENDWEIVNNLIGKRLEIKWSKGKYYAGTITNYKKGQHEVHYDDGEIKWYYLNTLVMRFIEKNKETVNLENNYILI